MKFTFTLTDVQEIGSSVVTAFIFMYMEKSDYNELESDFPEPDFPDLDLPNFNSDIFGCG